MKLLRMVLALVLAVAVPVTALSATLNDGHCVKHAVAADAHAQHASHAGHAGHAAPDGAPGGAMHDANGPGCDCGCACAGSHCTGGSGASALDVGATFPLPAAAARFEQPVGDPALAYSAGPLRPPTTD